MCNNSPETSCNKQEIEGNSSNEFLAFVSESFDSKETRDIELIILDEDSPAEQRTVYHLHRFALGQSLFFKELFHSGRWEVGKALNIEVAMYKRDVISDADISVFLKMFYEGDLNQMREEIVPRCLQMHHLSQKYRLNRGFAYCENLISESTDETTVANVLAYCLSMQDYASLAFTTCLQWLKVFFFVWQSFLGMDCIKIFDMEFLRMLASAPDFVTCNNGVPCLVNFYESHHKENNETFSLLKSQLLKTAKAQDDLFANSRSHIAKITSLLQTHDSGSPHKDRYGVQRLGSFEMYGFHWNLICIVDFVANLYWLSLNARSQKGVVRQKEDLPHESFNVKMKVYIIHRRRTYVTKHKGELKTNHVRLDMHQSISTECIANTFNNGMLGLISEVTIVRSKSRKRGNTW